ncbi:NUDIX hydrolase [Vibrio sp. DW001]|uniref:NUDIX hydrolase n=1 Tax=Vibrio sp. DW001 TaxID=2912315 RepID=UPI0023B0F94E|nr:NUDIX hydrolase [Vibrio sp. DW001]WED29351.1 NUDIX hydrolase [Vibrio sp. DW001]
MPKLIHQWKQLSLIEREMTLPNRVKVIHTTVTHPGATVILPIMSNGDILLLKQFRPSIDDWLYELPAGTLEHDELPIDCAMRELEEETGYSAKHFQSFGELIPLAGFCDEIQYLYIAKDLSQTARLTCDADEVIEILYLSIREVEDMIVNGTIIDSKTIACLLKAKLLNYI